ncbi:cytidyltransferase [Colwellia phage 9A]|uniref:Cytidyltransferase-like protein n=1 Tax=Colwellia phage 9A TaxID=765765 RepID=I3UM96_9CAUD|nr:cytidyltransferase [Colwellia phage 9A]AFK66611.1 cytidyltransferase-like protein [Colwellia phage 9A]
MEFWKVGIIPMRAQILTMGHVRLITRAKLTCSKLVIVLGSHNEASSVRNPFSAYERENLIREFIDQDSGLKQEDISFRYLEDCTDNDVWVKRFSELLSSIAATHNALKHSQMSMFGSDKDNDVEARKKWTSIHCTHIEPLSVHGDVLSATNIRDIVYGKFSVARKCEIFRRLHIGGKIPKCTQVFLTNYVGVGGEHHLRLCVEAQAIKEHINKYSRGKITHTGDALCVRWAEELYKGQLVRVPELLLIRRGGQFGNGLLAIAGGFMDDGETFRQSADRELFEELSVDSSCKPVISTVNFSAVGRDPRGRVITQAFRFDFKESDLDENVEARSDAKSFEWVPYYQLDKKEMFLDHYDIINELMKEAL